MSDTGALILAPEGLELSFEERRFFRDVNPFGFILFARNVAGPEQLRALCDDLRETVGRQAPILIDQEGGRVQRLVPPHWRAWPPPLDQVAAAGERAEEAMYLRARIIAHELHAVGIDGNCAPLVDVACDATHPFLRNRCYSTEPGAVARIGRAVAEGLLAGGVLPVVKHIPGHGRAGVDSHHELPVTEAPIEALRAVDFLPFRALRDMPMAMTAHVVYPAIDHRPATLSAPVMRVIREEIGFDGLVMSDDIGMKALSGTLEEIVAGTLAAGVDVILHCSGDLAEMRRVAASAGRLSPAAELRAARALAARRAPDEVDISSLAARLDALMDGRGDGG